MEDLIRQFLQMRNSWQGAPYGRPQWGGAAQYIQAAQQAQPPRFGNPQPFIQAAAQHPQLPQGDTPIHLDTAKKMVSAVQARSPWAPPQQMNPYSAPRYYN